MSATVEYSVDLTITKTDEDGNVTAETRTFGEVTSYAKYAYLEGATAAVQAAWNEAKEVL